jgi:hypothetical protein
MAVREREATGVECLDLITRLLQRLRLAHPTAGLWEAADLQWWWRKPRRSDEIGQTFWLDGSEPVAAVILTEWGRCWVAIRSSALRPLRLFGTCGPEP